MKDTSFITLPNRDIICDEPLGCTPFLPKPPARVLLEELDLQKVALVPRLGARIPQLPLYRGSRVFDSRYSRAEMNGLELQHRPVETTRGARQANPRAKGVARLDQSPMESHIDPDLNGGPAGLTLKS